MENAKSFQAIHKKEVVEKLLEKLALYFDIKIEGRDRVMAAAGAADWRAELTRLVAEGRTEGVTFTRTNQAKPTEDELRSFLSYYSFTDEQIKAWLRNIIG